jgi:ketosteroid isomerase-like protein
MSSTLRSWDVAFSARSSPTWSLPALGCVLALGCAASAPPSGASAPGATSSPARISTTPSAAVVAAPPTPAATLPARDAAGPLAAIHAVLDDWHRAAATADEARYFSHFTSDAIFLGTDKTERWDLHAFQTFAHPSFAKGKAWNFAPVRRDIVVGAGGAIAWFDEDLDTPNLGPTRGSGVVLRDASGAWKIAHYNLAITVPNERMKAVRGVIAGETAPAKP